MYAFIFDLAAHELHGPLAPTMMHVTAYANSRRMHAYATAQFADAESAALHFGCEMGSFRPAASIWLEG